MYSTLMLVFSVTGGGAGDTSGPLPSTPEKDAEAEDDDEDDIMDESKVMEEEEEEDDNNEMELEYLEYMEPDTEAEADDTMTDLET